MHARAWRNLNSPTEREFQQVVEALEETYAPVRIRYIRPFPNYVDFKRLVLSCVEWKSTPGIPLNRVGTTNAEVFGWNGFGIDDTKTRYVFACVKQRFEELKSGPAMDPINVFIKSEPHKMKKVRERGWRLIQGISIVDNLISRILVGDFCDDMIQKVEEIPNKAGWTPAKGGYRWLASRFPGEKLMADKSQWDWTMQGWVVEAIIDLLDRLSEHSSTPWWRTVVVNHFASLFHGCVFSVGRVRVRQTAFGVMKTGSLLTISLNSIAQVALHILAAKRSGTNWRRSLPAVLGDDTMQLNRVSLSYADELGKTGCIVKEMEVSTVATFGGHVFDERTCVPAYRPKHAWLIAHVEPEVIVETFASYQFLYALDADMLKLIQEILAVVDYRRLLSRRSLWSWYEGFETSSEVWVTSDRLPPE